MVIVVLVGLFAVSAVAVVIGYYNTLMGLDMLPIRLVFEEIPVLQAAILFTLLVPINITAAFFTSRGSYQAYKGELLALAGTTPFLVVFAVLPGATDLEGALQLNMAPMVVILVASQIGACHLLRDRAWRYGSSDVGT